MLEEEKSTILLDEDEGSDELHEEKIYCANCIHCKVVKSAVGNGSQYQLRVRCSEGMWMKKTGEEKFHKYFTLARRSMDECTHYNSMGETRVFLKKLRANLPTKDEIYQT